MKESVSISDSTDALVSLILMTLRAIVTLKTIMTFKAIVILKIIMTLKTIV